MTVKDRGKFITEVRTVFCARFSSCPTAPGHLCTGASHGTALLTTDLLSGHSSKDDFQVKQVKIVLKRKVLLSQRHLFRFEWCQFLQGNSTHS